MAEKLAARKGSAVQLPTRSTTVTLADGTVVAARDLLSFKGAEGRFRFHHANAEGTSVTCWGPCLLDMKDSDGQAAPWNSAQWRTFPTTAVKTVATIEAAKVKAAKVAAANGEVDYSSMTPGQKAAYTKRMRAMAVAA